MSSKGNSNLIDHHEMLFITNRISEFGVLLDFNKLQCADNIVSFSFPKSLTESLFELTRTLCCHKMARAIVLSFTRYFTLQFAHQNLVFYWISTSSGVQITADDSHSTKHKSELLFQLTRSLCCHQRPMVIVLTFTRYFSLLFAQLNCVLLYLNMLLCEDNSVSFSFPKTLVRGALELRSSHCCHQKATAIVLSLTRLFSLLFAHLNFVFYLISTCSGVKITA